VNVSFFRPRPRALHSATVLTAAIILYPHASIFSSHYGKPLGITFGKSSPLPDGLSPIFH